MNCAKKSRLWYDPPHKHRKLSFPQTMLPLAIIRSVLVSAKLFYGDREISLTKKEFEILAYFIHNSNRVLTYDQIYERVWGEVPYGSIQKLIAYHVKNLRQKLQNAPFEIRCCREVGYSFEIQSKPYK